VAGIPGDERGGPGPVRAGPDLAGSPGVAGLNDAPMSVSRRGLFSAFLKPLQAGSKSARALVAKSPLVKTDQVAVIQGRHCIAYQQSFCSVCYERCPVPGAIELNDGVPRIVLGSCTGCAICRDVCPAPENAVLLVPRRPGFGA